LEFPTFLEIFGFSSDNNSEKSLKQLFDVFDKEGKGAFGVEEFAAVCESVGERFSQAEI
jgi:Ca2+-binding EF-hand superfamily protein